MVEKKAQGELVNASIWEEGMSGAAARTGNLIKNTERILRKR